MTWQIRFVSSLELIMSFLDSNKHWICLLESTRLWSLWYFKKRSGRYFRPTLHHLLRQGQGVFLFPFFSNRDICLPLLCQEDVVLQIRFDNFVSPSVMNEGRASRRWNLLAVRITFSPWKHILGLWSSLYCNVGDILFVLMCSLDICSKFISQNSFFLLIFFLDKMSTHFN